MKTNKTTLLFGIAILLITSLGLLAENPATDEKEKFRIQMKIRRIKEKIKQFKKMRLDIVKQRNKFIKLHHKSKKILQKRAGNLNLEILSERLKLNKIIYKKNALQLQVSYYKKRKNGHRQIVISWLDKIQTSTKQSLPFNFPNRLSKLALLQKESKMKQISGLELFNRLFHFNKKELLTSFDSSVYKQRQKGSSIQKLRIGNILLYSLHNKQALSLFLPNKKSIKFANNSYSLSIKKAIKIIDGKKAPDFIALPIPLSIFHKLAISKKRIN